MKLLKNISGQLIQLYLGEKTVSLQPNDTVNYYDIVSENPKLSDYNLPLILSYLDQAILTVVSEMPIARTSEGITPDVIVNFSPAIPTEIQKNTSINFVNLTSIDLDSAIFTWNFSNETGATSIVYLQSTTNASQNPMVRFVTAGKYTVSLTAYDSNTGKTGSLMKSGLITVLP